MAYTDLITERELSPSLYNNLVKNNEVESKSVKVENIKGRTLVNLLGRSGNAIYQSWESKVVAPIRINLSYEGDSFIITTDGEPNSDRHIDRVVYLKKSSCYIFIGEYEKLVECQTPYFSYETYINEIEKGRSNEGYSNSIFATIIKTSPIMEDGEKHTIIRFPHLTELEKILKLKNMRAYQISEEEFNYLYESKHIENDKEMAEKYPYVDDVKCVVNPYFEAKENLLEGVFYGSYALDGDGNITLGDENYHIGLCKKINISKGTYTISSDLGLVINYISYTNKVSLLSAIGDGESATFNILEDGEIHLFRHVDNNINFVRKTIKELNTGVIKITLVKGSIPKSYEECTNSRLMFETKLYEGETISRRNDGIYVKNSEWEELLINNFNYDFHSSYTGYKRLQIKILTKDSKFGENNSTYHHFVAYNGEYINGGVDTSDNCYWVNNRVTEQYLYLHIPNTLTGWGDSYSPTQDEIKAFFLGWRMFTGTSLGNATIVNELYNGTGQKWWTKLWCGVGEKSHFITTADVVWNPINSCPTTMNDQGYTPYRLIYKKETPTIEEVKTYGGLVVKDGVDIVSGSGLVLGEENEVYLHISNYYSNSLHHYPTKRGNMYYLVNRTDSILSVFKNNEKCSIVNETLISSNTIGAGMGTSRIISQINHNDKVFIDYLIYKPDTVTSYNYITTIGITIKDNINIVNDEVVATKNELTKVNKELEYAREELSQRSNPNLLINGDFRNPVNQRGKREHNPTALGVYTIDRWSFHATTPENGTLKVNDKYITLTSTKEANTYIRQQSEIDWVKGEPTTLSIKYRNSSSVTFRVATTGNNSLFLPPTSGEWKISSISIKESSILSNNTVQTIIQNYNGSSFVIGSIDVEWIKLELGEYATPFVPRSYAEELRDCQKYYQRLMGYGFIGTAQAYSETGAYAFFPLATEIRTKTPTLTLKGNVSINKGYTTNATPITSLESSPSSRNGVLDVGVVSTGLTLGNTYLVFAESGDYIEVDAEIY